MLNIIQIPVLIDNYIYLLIDKGTSKCACVDPALSQPVIDVLNKLNLSLDFILNTHHHNDHVGANLELKNKYNCQIVGNKNDKKRIPGIDILLQEDDNFQIGESKCKVIEVSGHTLGHICFYFKNNDAVFCGDTLFSLGCGRLFEGTPELMVKSLLKIRALPDITKVYCAHEYTLSNAKFAQSLEPNNKILREKINEIKKKRLLNKPTIPSLLSEEKKFNPFLKFDDVNFINNIGLESISDEENFRVIRQMKDNF